MADKEPAAQGADQLTDDQLPPDDQQPPDDQAPPEDDEPEAITALAREMGWSPKDDFKGPAESWKPASQFIRDGRDIQRSLASELKTVRSTLDTVARTSASIVEQQVAEREAKLLAQFNAAVEDGDGKAALAASKELGDLQPQRPPAPQTSAEAEDFARRNASWFQKDPLATARAVELCNGMAANGFTDHGIQLKAAEQQIKREFPHLFGQVNGHKPQAGVAAPGSRSGAPSNRAKGFSDMPKENQDIARDMVNRGVIPNTDSYVKNWLATIQKKD